MSTLISDGKLVPCPFDPNHMVSEKRIKFHTLACAAKHRGKYETCKYNDVHFVPIGQLQSHYTSCPDYMAAVQHVKHAVVAEVKEPPLKNLPTEMKPSQSGILKTENKGNKSSSSNGFDGPPGGFQLHSTFVDPNFKLLAPVDWDRIKNLHTFEPLTKFQLQTLTKGDRSKYHNYLIKWQKWKISQR